MGQRCRVCDHEQRDEIEREMIAGRSSLAKLARDFGVGESNLWRHQKKCIASTLASEQETRELGRGRDLHQQLLKLSKRAERLADIAEAKNNLAAAVSAVRELGRLIAIEAQFYPPPTLGKIPLTEIQALVSAYNRNSSRELPEDAIVVEALPAPDEEN